MKNILTIIVIILAVLLIYLGFKDKNIYYLSIGDSLANGTNSVGVEDYGYGCAGKESTVILVENVNVKVLRQGSINLPNNLKD